MVGAGMDLCCNLALIYFSQCATELRSANGLFLIAYSGIGFVSVAVIAVSVKHSRWYSEVFKMFIF